MKRGFSNQKKKRFLESIPTASLESATDKLSGLCKFNFAYFCPNSGGQDFAEWEHNELVRLLEKTQEINKKSLIEWENGKDQFYVVYKDFPSKTEFQHPKHVPHDVYWARFRLTQIVRLVGFVIPSHLAGKKQQATGLCFDTNTFYVVFLDKNHRFWLTGKE